MSTSPKTATSILEALTLVANPSFFSHHHHLELGQSVINGYKTVTVTPLFIDIVIQE
jgi:hypothetical protein